MAWTIKSKIILIGALSIGALVVMAGISIWASSNASDLVYASEDRGKQLRIVNAMRRDNLTVLLGAMDSIVDKDEGVVAPERMTEMTDALAGLRKSAKTLVSIADNGDEKQLAEQIASQIEGLHSGITKDLVQAIESRASDEEFGKLDDVLDQFGAGMDQSLGEYAASVEEELVEDQGATHDALDFAVMGSVVALVVALVVLSALLFVVGRSIVGPLGGMTAAMRLLSEGKKDTEIPHVGQADEIGTMAEAVQIFKDNMIKAEELAAEQAAQQQKQIERAKTIEALTSDFDTHIRDVLGTVTSASTQLNATANSMSATAEEATSQAATVAAAAEQASANVQTVASATEELTSSISEISRQVADSTAIASGAVQEANRTNELVQGLADSVSKIGEVVELITDIAEQTNLLALNATIEAARAGDAGKGFAVVASEVKNLANQTGKATEDIAKQIAEIQGATKGAVEAIQGITGTIGKISEIAAAIAAAVEEQGAATQEIARNVEEASTGTQEVSANIIGVSQAAQETGSASVEVRDASQELSQQADALTRQVDSFLTQIRAV